MRTEAKPPLEERSLALRARLVARVEARGQRRRRRSAAMLAGGLLVLTAAAAPLLQLVRPEPRVAPRPEARAISIERAPTRARPWIERLDDEEISSWLRAAKTAPARVTIGDQTTVLALDDAVGVRPRQ